LLHLFQSTTKLTGQRAIKNTTQHVSKYTSHQNSEMSEQPDSTGSQPANFQVIPGSRIETKNYLFEGKLYLVDKKNGDILHVRCKEHRNLCPGRGRIQDGFFEEIRKHTCKITAKTGSTQVLKHVLKTAARNSPDELRSVYNRTVFSEEFKDSAENLSYIDVHASMKLARQRSFPKNVDTPQEVINFLEGNSHPQISNFYVGSISYTLQGENKVQCKVCLMLSSKFCLMLSSKFQYL